MYVIATLYICVLSHSSICNEKAVKVKLNKLKHS